MKMLLFMLLLVLFLLTMPNKSTANTAVLAEMGKSTGTGEYSLISLKADITSVYDVTTDYNIVTSLGGDLNWHSDLISNPITINRFTIKLLLNKGNWFAGYYHASNGGTGTSYKEVPNESEYPTGYAYATASNSNLSQSKENLYLEWDNNTFNTHLYYPFMEESYKHDPRKLTDYEGVGGSITYDNFSLSYKTGITNPTDNNTFSFKISIPITGNYTFFFKNSVGHSTDMNSFDEKRTINSMGIYLNLE